MGKQQRRRRRHHHHHHHRNRGGGCTDDEDDNAAPLSQQTSSSLAILKRIRHADPHTRLAALTYLTQHPSVLLLLRQQPLDLLAAVRERVMDSDSMIATTAVAVLHCALELPVDDQVSSGWILLLVERLSTSSTDFLPLIQQCLSCLCLLLETNPVAMQRLLRNEQLAIQCVQSLTQWLQPPVVVLPTTAEEHQLSVNIVTAAAQGLHSALDDNLELVELYWQDVSRVQQTLTALQNVLHGPAGIASLHAAGTILAIWKVAPALLVPCDGLIEPALSLLTVKWNSTEIRNMLMQLQTAYCDLQNEQNDAVLERQVLAAAATTTTTTAKSSPPKQRTVLHDDDKQDDDGRVLEEHAKDCQEIWYQIESEWKQQFRPYTLALEILTNVTACNDDDDDDDEMQIGLEEHISQLVLDIALPDSVCTLLSLLVAGDWKPSGELPPTVTESLSDLYSKVSTCLCHCISNIPSWNVPVELWSLLLAGVQQDRSLSAAAVVAIRERPPIRHQVSSTQLEILLQLLHDPSTRSTPFAVRDAITIVGILCSEPHDATVNEKVCGSLLQVVVQIDDTSPAATMIIAEVLNVLMDMYGGDSHLEIFDRLHVLAFFQRSVPVLKQRIRNESNDENEDEVEAWKEIVMNASRFIQYKKGYES